MFAALAAAPARGALVLTLSEPGFASVTGVASGSTDTFVGTYGTFTTDVVIGFSNSSTPAGSGQIQIQSLDVTNTSSTGGNALTITFSDNGFTFPGTVGQSLSLASALSGTLTTAAAGDTVTFRSTATPSSGAAATTGLQSFTVPASPSSITSVQVSPAASATFTETGSYTLSDQISLALANPGETANLSGTTVASVTVPEPATASALGLAAIALAARRRRRA